MEVEQLSFFSLPARPAVAVCCMDGRSFHAEPAEGWMQRLVSGAEYFILTGGHQMALRPTQKPSEGIQTGHEYYHYHVGKSLYAGVFVGRDSA